MLFEAATEAPLCKVQLGEPVLEMEGEGAERCEVLAS